MHIVNINGIRANVVYLPCMLVCKKLEELLIFIFNGSMQISKNMRRH